MRPHHLLTALALALALAPATAAAPQETAQGKDFVVDPSSHDALDLVERRSRDLAHPGNPLQVIGLGQGDNDFRAGMHAAARGDYVPAAVDTAAAHQRQLAMFDGGAAFDRPLRSAFARTDSPGPMVPRSGSAHSDGAEQEPAPKPADTTWIGILVAMAATVCLYLTRPSGRI